MQQCEEDTGGQMDEQRLPPRATLEAKAAGEG